MTNHLDIVVSAEVHLFMSLEETVHAEQVPLKEREVGKWNSTINLCILHYIYLQLYIKEYFGTKMS